jgi:quercetin dioxygenase-like cupin family protein
MIVPTVDGEYSSAVGTVDLDHLYVVAVTRGGVDMIGDVMGFGWSSTLGRADMTEAIIIPPNEGTTFIARGSHMDFKALAATTHGSFSLMERQLPPGGRRPPRHSHIDCDEAFYVLDGEVDFWVGGDTTRQGTGAFVLVPGGTMHSFGNLTSTEARVLIIHAPAMDKYFEALHELWSGDTPPSTAQEQDLMRQHGMLPET